MGWRVALLGLGINLALGVLYTWSMFKGAIEKDFGWKGSQLNDPYAICLARFRLCYDSGRGEGLRLSLEVRDKAPKE